MTIRPVTTTFAGRPASDGAGVKLTRIIGSPPVEQADPFLLLDAFASDKPGDYIAGFPSHPHRGFETVTYMLAGAMRHKDNLGNEGVITPGGVQWMTAGRGIIHSEMPEQEDGLMHGFQLWVNLPADHKMTAPGYQEFAADQIPHETRPGADIAVITGTTSFGIKGPVRDVATDPLYLDIRLDAGATLNEPISDSHTAFAYVISGQVSTAGIKLPVNHVALFGDGDTVSLQAGDEGARLLLVAGRKLDEPIARYGPFVMNTHEQLQQAFNDYHAGRF